MTVPSFDVLTRHASAAISRRGSLLAIGGASLAALTPSPAIHAAKNVKKKARKQGKKKCKKQVGQCTAYWEEYCQLTGGCDPQVLEAFLVCCELLGTCQNAAFFECIVDAETGVQPL